MEAPFPFEPLLVFGSLAIFLLVGVVLRSKVGFFQRFLIPSCLIGGFLGMILRNTGIIPLPVSLLETIVYHLFNISFISLGLTRGGSPEKSTASGKEKISAPLGMGLIEGVIFPLQVIIGGLLVILFGFLGFHLFSTFGFLSPLGFIEGPGQAISLGKVWEGFGFAHAATIGLTFATIGFFVAFFVGVPLVNWGIRNGLSTYAPKKLPLDFRRGITSKDQKKEIGGRLTTHSANVDAFAFQAALVGLVFVLTYGLVRSLAGVLPSGLSEILWGFFFFFGLVIALITRWIVERAGSEYLIDEDLQKRISGWAVDFLIVAMVVAIQLAIVWKFIAPILVIAVATGALTTLMVYYLGKRIWPKHNLERMAAIYGTVTGTVPSGLLLVRIADPEFKTPAAIELGFMLIFAAPFVLTSMLLVNAPVLWGWSVGLTVLVFVGIFVLALGLLKIFRLWGEPQF